MEKLGIMFIGNLLVFVYFIFENCACGVGEVLGNALDFGWKKGGRVVPSQRLKVVVAPRRVDWIGFFKLYNDFSQNILKIEVK